MVAMQGCDLQGEDSLSSSPLYVPVWITDSTVVQPTDFLGYQLVPCWSNNLSSGNMLKGPPSSNAARSDLLWHYKAPSFRRLRTKPVR